MKGECMRFSLGFSPWVPWWRFTEWLSNTYWRRRNEVIICCECGTMEIPENSLPNEYGWKKLKNPKRWVCHHCFDHCDDYKVWGEGWTPEAWAEWVMGNNSKIRNTFPIHNYRDIYTNTEEDEETEE